MRYLQVGYIVVVRKTLDLSSKNGRFQFNERCSSTRSHVRAHIHCGRKKNHHVMTNVQIILVCIYCIYDGNVYIPSSLVLKWYCSAAIGKTSILLVSHFKETLENLLND